MSVDELGVLFTVNHHALTHIVLRMFLAQNQGSNTHILNSECDILLESENKNDKD